MRAFIALPLPLDLQQRIKRLQEELTTQLPGVRWVRPAQLHLTLRFFPDLAEESLDPIREIMLSVGNFCAPFTVEIRGLGAFPNPARPRVLWLGLTPIQPLLHLQHNVEQGLERIGIAKDERPFKPHLTIGRIKDRAARQKMPPTSESETFRGHWPIGDMVFYQSRLGATGAIHTPLIRTVLSGCAPH